MAPDFVLGAPTNHAFDSIAMGVAQIKLTMFYADISGDASVSFNSAQHRCFSVWAVDAPISSL